MMQNVETLPESSQGLIAQLDGLQKREDGIKKEKETLSAEKGRLSDQIVSLNSQMRLVENYGQRRPKMLREKRLGEDNPAYVALIQKRAELSAKLENLKTVRRLTDKNPDVIAAKNDINKINEEIEGLKKGRKSASKMPTKQARAKPNCKNKTS